MTPPPTLAAALLDNPWFRDPVKRRSTYFVGAIVASILAVWPRPYMAETELLPQQGGGGLSQVLAQQAGGMLLDLGALTGNKESIESDLTIARSNEVLLNAVKKIDASGQRFKNFSALTLPKAIIKLKHSLGIIAIRGSIIQITAHDHNPELAKAMVTAVATSIQDRLAVLSIQEADQKRAVAENRLQDATVRLVSAQRALDEFRLANKLPEPEAALGLGTMQLVGLQEQLRSKQLQLSALQQTSTSNNLQVQMLRAQIADTQRQIQSLQTPSAGPTGPNISQISNINQQYLNLYRDERSADMLYQVYKRYLDEVNIDVMSASENLDIIEPPYVNPERQYNIPAVGLLFLIIVLAIASEIYNIRPPIGRR